jgi:hypothetical protein
MTEEFVEKRQKLAEFLLHMATGLSWAETKGVDDFHSNYLLDAEDILRERPHLLSLTTLEAMEQDEDGNISLYDFGVLHPELPSESGKKVELATNDIYDLSAEEQEKFFKAQAEAARADTSLHSIIESLVGDIPEDVLTEKLIMALADKLDISPHELRKYPIVDGLPTVVKRWCCEGKSCGNVLLSLMAYEGAELNLPKRYDYVRANGRSYTHDRRTKGSTLNWLENTKNNINKE